MGPKLWISIVTVLGAALLAIGVLVLVFSGGVISRALVLGAVLFGFGQWMRARALRDASSPPTPPRPDGSP
jgi:hypothetical protein